MVACRAAAEKTCYALGPPKKLKETYFDAGKVSQPGRWGAYLLDMGVLTCQERQDIVAQHKENLQGATLVKAEDALLELRWCEASPLLDAIDGHRDDRAISVFGMRFRRRLTPYYKLMAADPGFRHLCLRRLESPESPAILPESSLPSQRLKHSNIDESQVA